MLDVAGSGGGSSSPVSRMAPELSSQHGEGSVPGTPPHSPALNGQFRRLSTGKEEDAVMSLMKLATPVKSPGPRGGTGASGPGETTPEAEMTPVSLFRKSRQPGELGGQQSPFQSPLKSFQFSPSCLFSPPGAGTLDFPLAGGDTPGPGLTRDWHHASPDRRGVEDARRGVRGITGGGGGGNIIDGDIGSGGGAGAGGGGGRNTVGLGGGTPGSCGKRKGKALFTDKRGPQDHSRGLAQSWCLGTPGRSSPRDDGSGVVHLDVTDIPATPERTAGADGSAVLPPTPRLLPPTPRSSSRQSIENAGGDGAAGILMGLRSPETSSTFSGNVNISHPFLSGLGNGGGGSAVVERGWGEDWENRARGFAGGGSGGSGGGDNGRGSGGFVGRNAPHSAPAKRHKRWASPSVAVSLRDAHCKGSFTIERGTLIRSSSSSSSSVACVGVSSLGGSSSKSSIKSSSSSRKQSRGATGGGGGGGGGDAGASRGSNCRVRSRGQSIAEEPLSPATKRVLSPESTPLTMSRRSVSLSPARAPAPRKAAGGGGGAPSTAPRPSGRGARGERSRKGPAAAAALAAAAASSTASAVTPSPAATTASSRSGRSSNVTPRSSSGGTPTRVKPELESSSFNSPEPTTSTASLRRGRGSAQKHQRLLQKAEEGDEEEGVAGGAEAEAVAAAVVVGSAGAGAPGHAPTTCNCKKSKCLKLYCECFQRRQYCSDCNCMECLNTARTEDLRQVAIQSTIERNPLAFESKFEKRAGKRSHNSGCNCKKSACLKKYCECFQASVACGSNCKCSNCKNYEGAAGGRKRRATETVLALPPRTPPRPSGRGRGSAGAAAIKGDALDGSAGVPPRVPMPSPDHHVQVGGDDDGDADSSPPSPLVEALRGNGGGDGHNSAIRPTRSPAGSLPSAEDESGNCSSGSGGGDPSDTPPAAAAAAAQGKRAAAAAAGSGRSASSSPAASAVADCAVERSLLDMGGTPLQVQRDEVASETKFELSVAARSPGGVENLSARLKHQREDEDGGGDGVGGCGGGARKGKSKPREEKEDTVGMGALLSRARKEAKEKKKSATQAANAAAGTGMGFDAVGRPTADDENAGDGNGGLVASSGSKAGGAQACLTPPTPATWKGIGPGFGGVAANGANPAAGPGPGRRGSDRSSAGAPDVGAAAASAPVAV